MKVTRIGIDQSLTSTAVTIIPHEDQSLAVFWVIETKPNEYDDGFCRINYIATCVIDFIRESIKNIGESERFFTEVVIEGLSFGSSTNATRDLAALQYAIIDKIRSSPFGDVIRIVAPTSLKKFASGKGNSKKEVMFEFLPPYIQDRFNDFPKSRGRYDLMDSYFLAFYQEGETFKEPFVNGDIDFSKTLIKDDYDRKQITFNRINMWHKHGIDFSEEVIENANDWYYSDFGWNGVEELFLDMKYAYIPLTHEGWW